MWSTVAYGNSHLHSYANTYSPESDAYIYSYANTNSDSYVYTNCNCHVYSDANGYSPESDAYIYTYANANSDSDRTVQPDANTITDFYTNSDCGTCRN